MNKQSFTILMLLLAMLGATLACGSSGDTSNNNNGGAVIPESVWGIDEIVFAGKIVESKNGEWTNNRLVLLFLNSKEIARTVSSTTEYTGRVTDKNPPKDIGLTREQLAQACVNGSPEVDESMCGGYSIRLDNKLGIADGVFILRIPNAYELNIENLGLPTNEIPFVQVKEDDGQENRLGVWMASLNEGESREFYIPSKNIHYVVMVLSGDISQLPAEIQQPGSVRLSEGNLVAIDPTTPEPALPSFSDTTRFEQITESVNELSSSVFPINNCGGATEIKQEITHTYVHEIIDETSGKLGIEIPVFEWLKIVAEVERKYGVADKEVTSYSTTLTVPAGNNIEYTVLRKQIWESGVVVMQNDGTEVSAAYRILKNEVFEVANSEQKPCP